MTSSCCLYYTAHRHAPEIEAACRAQLDKARGNIPLVAVGLEPFSYGDVTIVLPLEPGPLTLHRQILAGLRLIESEMVWFCENDVLYHPSHFDRELPGGSTFYYNTNVWRVRYTDGHAVWTDDLEQTSGLCADRQLLMNHYERRIAEIERGGFDRHFEPGPKTSPCQAGLWHSDWPILDIRHGANMTRSKWRPEEFRNQRYAQGWSETDYLPGWGDLWTVMQGVKNYAAI